MKTIRVTPLLTLRPLQRGDEADIFHAIDSGRGHLGRWLPFVEHTRTVDDSRAYVESTLETGLELVFTLRLDGRFIGLAGFKEIATDGSRTEIGYWMRERYEGHGYITAAVRELMRFAKDGLGITGEIFIKCAVGNTRSRNIPLRLGFAFRCVEPSGEIVSDGVFRDIEIYSLRIGDGTGSL